MTTRSARFLLSVCLILCTSPGFAQCDVYDAYVQAGAGSSEYYSSAVARCYWQGISRVCGHGLVNVRMYSDSPSASESNRPLPVGRSRGLPSNRDQHGRLLWTDANHDGVSQPEELRGVAMSPIEATWSFGGRIRTGGTSPVCPKEARMKKR